MSRLRGQIPYKLFGLREVWGAQLGSDHPPGTTNLFKGQKDIDIAGWTYEKMCNDIRAGRGRWQIGKQTFEFWLMAPYCSFLGIENPAIGISGVWNAILW
jgi:hypothetical protein